MLTGFTPFTGRNEHDFINNQFKGTYKVPNSLMLSLDCFSLINGCLRYNEDDRMSTEELMNHPYILKPDFETKVYTTKERQHMIKLEILEMKPDQREPYNFLNS